MSSLAGRLLLIDGLAKRCGGGGGDFKPLKWINSISITVNDPFVSSMIFCSTVYLLSLLRTRVSLPIVSHHLSLCSGLLLTSRQGAQLKQTLQPRPHLRRGSPTKNGKVFPLHLQNMSAFTQTAESFVVCMSGQ